MSVFSFSKPESFKFKARKIGIVAFPDVEVLDVAGPYEVFNFANIVLQGQGLTKKKFIPFNYWPKNLAQ